MDKNKVKEALKSKLRQEMSMTGTGASVTPGAGEGVATKYAFGKSNNKGTPSDWKAAPSIPNRKSKAMDYKELWEGKIHIGTDTKTDSDIFFEPETGVFSINVIDAAGNRTNKLQVNTIDDVLAKFPSWKWTDAGKAEFADTLDEAYTPSTTNVEELARVEALLAKAHEDNAYSVMSSYEFTIKALRLLVGLEKKYKTTLPLLKFSMSFIDYLQKYFPGFKGKFGPYNQKWRSVYDHIDQSLSQKQNMNEDHLEEGIYIPDNIMRFAKRKGVEDIVKQVARWIGKADKRIAGGTAIGKDYSTLILDLTYQGGEIRINTDTDEIEVKGEEVYDYKSFVEALGDSSINEIDTNNSSTDEILTYLQVAKQQGKLSPDAQQVLIQWMNSPGASREEIIKVLRQLTGMYLNENYARFRNETKTRTKPEQFHNAVKEVKKKVQEINRLFEYMNRLQSELKESEGGLKTKKYTENALNQIKEATKQLFFKSTKLK